MCKRKAIRSPIVMVRVIASFRPRLVKGRSEESEPVIQVMSAIGIVPTVVTAVRERPPPVTRCPSTCTAPSVS